MNVVYDTSVSGEDYKHQKGAGDVCCVCYASCVLVRPVRLVQWLVRARSSLVLLPPVKREVECAMASQQSAKLTLSPEDYQWSSPGG